MKLQLSEAILLGSALGPQCFSHYEEGDATCALGAACKAAGQDEIQILRLWPCLSKAVRCPVCYDRDTLWAVIAEHLNDQHRWTRERIAEWVSTVEPQESVTSSADEASNEEALGPDQVGTGLVAEMHGELGMTPSAVHVPGSSADSYSVSDHAFEHSEHVMGRGNVNG